MLDRNLRVLNPLATPAASPKLPPALQSGWRHCDARHHPHQPDDPQLKVPPTETGADNTIAKSPDHPITKSPYPHVRHTPTLTLGFAPHFSLFLPLSLPILGGRVKDDRGLQRFEYNESGAE